MVTTELQNRINEVYEEVYGALKEALRKVNALEISLTKNIVYQYFSEINQEYIHTIDNYTGSVMIKSNSGNRYIKLKELSSQDLVNIIKCIEKNDFTISKHLH